MKISLTSAILAFGLFAPALASAGAVISPAPAPAPAACYCTQTVTWYVTPNNPVPQGTRTYSLTPQSGQTCASLSNTTRQVDGRIGSASWGSYFLITTACLSNNPNMNK